ncbi:MAG: ROK family transcriptional regulator [Acidimicrobiia bacterium]|nr:ROK family transcriptional regulator [Acidimicrobiia bacterium]
MESPGQLLELIRAADGITRSDLAMRSGLARSTITHRIESLLDAGFVVEAGEARSTGGRPPTLLRFNSESGVVLVADLGATHARFAVTTLDATVLADVSMDLLIADGPEPVLRRTMATFDELLATVGRTDADVRGVGIGVPGPIDFAAGRPSDPPIMPGWHDYPIGARFTDRFGVPTLIDNDVNIMALGEFWLSDPRPTSMVVLKIGTGIGGGIIVDGQILRGAKGAAGNVGHIQTDTDAVCNCGNTGCLEGVAGGAALAAELRAAGYDTVNTRDVVALVIEGNADAIAVVREAGRRIGGMLAGVINLLNPESIVINGDLVRAGQPLLAGLREAIYHRATALTTNDLQVRASHLGDGAGVIGGAVLVIEHVLDPAVVDAELDGRVGAVA